LFIIFSIGFGKRDQFGIFEKFVIILWILMLGVFDITAKFGIRYREAFGGELATNIGITFLPGVIEFILLLFVALLLILSFFVGINEKILTLMTLLIINTVFITLTFTTANYFGFVYNLPVDILKILGNILVIAGTIMCIVCTFLVLRIKYPKSLAKRSKG
jgi:hypothetical protein